MKKIILATILLFISSNLLAAISCSTYSKGEQFENTHRSLSIARNNVLIACKKDFRTSNYECRRNVECDKEETKLDGNFYVCETLSGGSILESEAVNELEALTDLTRQCNSRDRKDYLNCMKLRRCYKKFR
jgi:hypothetical protein